MLGASRWAVGGGYKRRRRPWSQRRASPFVRGHGPRGRGAHSGGRGGNSAHVLVLGGCTHLGFRENAAPFAGVRATGSLQGARRVRDHEPGCRARAPSFTGIPTVSRSARDRGVRGPGRAGDSPLERAPNLGSIGSVRCGVPLQGRAGIGSSFAVDSRREPARPRKWAADSKRGGGREHREREKRCSRPRRTRKRRPAARARTSYVLQMSTGRLRSQRSARAAPCRVESPRDETGARGRGL